MLLRPSRLRRRGLHRCDLRTISEIAEKFGSGKVTFTSRLSAEIVGIPFEQIDAACDYAAERGLYFGGTGAKIRPVTACKGTTCVYGNYDTQALAKELHEKYYVGWANVKLPHKFKIGIGGCPNSCMKPSLNDFGIEGHRVRSSTKTPAAVQGLHGRKIMSLQGCTRRKRQIIYR